MTISAPRSVPIFFLASVLFLISACSSSENQSLVTRTETIQEQPTETNTTPESNPVGQVEDEVEEASETSEATKETATEEPTEEEEEDGPGYAGTIPAPEFPTNLDWLNTEGALSLADLRG